MKKERQYRSNQGRSPIKENESLKLIAISGLFLAATILVVSAGAIILEIISMGW